MAEPLPNRVVHVETGRHFYGGAQQVLYIARGLQVRGVDSVLVCPPQSGIAAAARAAELTVIETPCAGDLDLRFVWRLRQILADLKPDLVHCHSRRGGDFLGGQAAAMLGLPAVVSRRVDNPESALMASLRYRRFRRVVAISEAIAAVLEGAGVKADRIAVIRSAVDTERFKRRWRASAWSRSLALAADQLALACAAQLIPRKGQRLLLDAVARLRADHPTIRIVLFGQGPEEAALRTQSAELNLEDTVHFAGFRDDLDDYLGAFDLLVHPALAEGLGVITLKAQAAGVPVVASAAGGLIEAVHDGETGTLVPPGDVAALTDALRTLLDDSELRARYAKAAPLHMQTSFSIDAMVEAHLRVYRAVLNDAA